MSAFQALTLTDMRNVGRDSLLRFLLFYPWILGIGARFLIPFITDALAPRFDLTPYYPLLVGFFGILITPQLAGYVVGFLLLDERDDGTLTALRVTPLSMNRYLAYRLAAPLLISFVAIFIVIPLMGLIDLDYAMLLPIGLVAAVGAPIFALLLFGAADNKVQGFAVMKGLGIFFLGPFVAWFVPAPWQYLLGVFPTYWPVMAFWTMLDGGPWLVYLAIGLVYNGLWVAVLLRRYHQRLARTS